MANHPLSLFYHRLNESLHESIYFSTGIRAEIAIVSSYFRSWHAKKVAIRLNSLSYSTTNNLRIYYIVNGKFEWTIHEQPHLLYSGDIALILPGQMFGGTWHNEHGLRHLISPF